MAHIEVFGADPHHGTVSTLQVRFTGVAPRTIDRATALEWLAGGHSMITVAGEGSHAVRGHAIERVEVDGAVYLRTDTTPEAHDHLEFPHGH